MPRRLPPPLQALLTFVLEHPLLLLRSAFAVDNLAILVLSTYLLAGHGVVLFFSLVSAGGGLFVSGAEIMALTGRGQGRKQLSAAALAYSEALVLAAFVLGYFAAASKYSYLRALPAPRGKTWRSTAKLTALEVVVLVVAEMQTVGMLMAMGFVVWRCLAPWRDAREGSQDDGEDWTGLLSQVELRPA